MSELRKLPGLIQDLIMQHWVREWKRKNSFWLFCEASHASAGASHSPAFPTQKHCFCSSGKLIVPDEVSSSCVFSLHYVPVCVPEGQAVTTRPAAEAGFLSERESWWSDEFIASCCCGLWSLLCCLRELRDAHYNTAIHLVLSQVALI